jgi:hypothetical protein
MSANAATVAEAWDISCPRCRRDECIEVQLTVWAVLTPDGTDIEAQDHEWHPTSQARCSCCGHYAQVAHFWINRGRA